VTSDDVPTTPDLPSNRPPALVTSPAGRAAIEAEEGVVLRWYYDFAGYETGGMGHRRVDGDPPFVEHGPLPQSLVDAWATNDLRTTEACVRSFVADNIGQNMFDALVSLGFNIGTGAERVSSVARMMRVGGYLAAADHFRDWNKVLDRKTGLLVVSPILTARRERERARFLLDVSTLDDAGQA